jgi:hypothetical protein
MRLSGIFSQSVLHENWNPEIKVHFGVRHAFSFHPEGRPGADTRGFKGTVREKQVIGNLFFGASAIVRRI